MEKLREVFLWIRQGSKQVHPSLFQLRAFWVVAGIPIFLSAFVWLCILHSINYPEIELTLAGFERAYEYFKIPLWIAALALPFAGFFATNYRSVETAKQISIATQQMKITEQKNNFENTLRHQERFNEKLDQLSSKYSVNFFEREYLYKAIFSKNSFDYFSPWCDEMDMSVKIGEETSLYPNFFIAFRHYIGNFNSYFADEKIPRIESLVADDLYFLMHFLSVLEIDGVFYNNAIHMRILNTDRAKQLNQDFLHNVLSKVSSIANELEVYSLSPEMRREYLEIKGAISFDDKVLEKVFSFKPVYRSNGLDTLKALSEDEALMSNLRLRSAYRVSRDRKLKDIKAFYSSNDK